MSEAFTPGPWHWNTDHGLWSKKDGEIITAGDDGGAYGSHSGTIDHHYDPATKEANKNLIAAAPDLYAAAMAAIAYDEAIEQSANDPAAMSSFCTAQGDSLDSLYMDWMTKARAALAKARGE